MSSSLEPFIGYAPYLALLMRLFLGASLTIHGYPKVKGGWKRSGQWVKSMGIPAVAATIVEFFGGIFLMLGLIVPVVSAFAAVEFAAIIAMKRSKMHARYISLSRGSLHTRSMPSISPWLWSYSYWAPVPSRWTACWGSSAVTLSASLRTSPCRRTQACSAGGRGSRTGQPR